MKLTNNLHKNGALIFASSLAAISLSSCGGFMAKETNTNSDVIATLASSEQDVEEAASSAVAANDLAEPEKKKGIFGRLFNRSKKAPEGSVDTTTDIAGGAVDTTASGVEKTTDAAGATGTKITDVAKTTPANVVRSTTDTTRNIASSATDTDTTAMRKTTDEAGATTSRVDDTVSSAIGKTTPEVKIPSRPDVVLPDDDVEMIDKVPTLTSETPRPSKPALDDDGFLPLTPSPKLPGDEGILVPGE